MALKTSSQIGTGKVPTRRTDRQYHIIANGQEVDDRTYNRIVNAKPVPVDQLPKATSSRPFSFLR
ncbi:MAG: hypothetical protein J2P37_00135 [Ktedonobacteraceae bacterium]|nr:hypothetical protein [Ktedonobacteraceae bacterium]